MDNKKQEEKNLKVDSIAEREVSPTVYVIFISLIIDLLGFTIILPLLPSILDYYGENDKQGLYHWLESKVQYFQVMLNAPSVFNRVLFGGLIGSLFSFLQFLASPILGALSDVYGRKPVLIISMCGIAASYCVWAVAHSFYLFVLARIIGGISKGNISLSAAVVADVSTPKNRGKGMALIGIAFSVGFIVGPMIGACFAAYYKQFSGEFFVAPAIFALILAIGDIIFLLLYFKESLPKEKQAKSLGHGLITAYNYISPASLFSFRPVTKLALKDLATLKKVGLIYFLYLFIYSGLEYSLTFLTHIRFMYTSMQQGKMYLFSGIIMVLVQGGYARRIPPGKELHTVVTGLVLIIPSFIIMGIARCPTLLYGGLALYAFASATVVPCLTTLVSAYGSVDQKGTVLGIFRSLGALARALGPFIASVGYWCLGSTMCYCLGGLLLTLPLYMTVQLRKNLEEKR